VQLRRLDVWREWVAQRDVAVVVSSVLSAPPLHRALTWKLPARAVVQVAGQQLLAWYRLKSMTSFRRC
jgi:hypothetical protein